MTERETVLLGEFKVRLDKLINLHLRIIKEKQQLVEEQLLLKEQIRLLSLKNNELVKKNEDLKFAKSLLGGENENHEAKLKINKLVREIDKCIALMNK